MIDQITVMIENRPGRLSDVLTVLSAEQIDLEGITIAESSDFGVCRMILSDPERGKKALEKAGFITRKTEVLAVEVEDEPGSLERVFTLLREEGINLQYVYAFGAKFKGRAMIILKSEENGRSEALLMQAGIHVLTSEELKARLV